MAHDHSHQHHSVSYNPAFAIAISLNLAFVIIQGTYALIANSMSLLADAGHNLGDVIGLLLAWGATWLLTRETSDRYSYGHKKASILAAMSNGLILLVTSVLIIRESIEKLIHPAMVNETIVIIVAFIGIIINGGTALLFIKGSKDDLNIKGAFLHLAADSLISVGVVIAGIIILFTGWDFLDPIFGLVIVVFILFASWNLLRDSINLVLDAVPSHIDHEAVRSYLEKITGVEKIHDLHIWGLSTRENALTAHLVMPSANLSDENYHLINQDLLHKFNIHHVTLQVEQGLTDYECHSTKTCN